LINLLLEINFDIYYFLLYYLLQTLQEYFKTNQYPTRQSKAILAEELCLTYEQVPPPSPKKKEKEKEKHTHTHSTPQKMVTKRKKSAGKIILLSE
jgi:Homeodomain